MDLVFFFHDFFCKSIATKRAILKVYCGWQFFFLIGFMIEKITLFSKCNNFFCLHRSNTRLAKLENHYRLVNSQLQKHFCPLEVAAIVQFGKQIFHGFVEHLETANHRMLIVLCAMKFYCLSTTVC